jgi:hypothetical protein
LRHSSPPRRWWRCCGQAEASEGVDVGPHQGRVLRVAGPGVHDSLPDGRHRALLGKHPHRCRPDRHPIKLKLHAGAARPVPPLPHHVQRRRPGDRLALVLHSLVDVWQTKQVEHRIWAGSVAMCKANAYNAMTHFHDSFNGSEDLNRANCRSDQQGCVEACAIRGAHHVRPHARAAVGPGRRSRALRAPPPHAALQAGTLRHVLQGWQGIQAHAVWVPCVQRTSWTDHLSEVQSGEWRPSQLTSGMEPHCGAELNMYIQRRVTTLLALRSLKGVTPGEPHLCLK